MRQWTRRELLGGTVGFAALGVLGAAAKAVRISDVDIFDIKIPVTPEEQAAGVQSQFSVVQVLTNSGVNGYSFTGPRSPRSSAIAFVRKILIGRDLFSVEGPLQDGLYKWGGVEHAVWDAIGKVVDQPVYKLLGGSQDKVKAYLTCVWQGPLDQSHVSYRQQAEMAAKIEKAGFKGMKIRAWRPDPMADVEACREIRSAVSKDFAVMFDRTADLPKQAGQKVWDFETGHKVALGLQAAGAHWLEEPFVRDDYESPAKLARMVDILITGGEGYTGLDSYRECLTHHTYDILQPDGRTAGGIYLCRKVSILAESFHIPTILHGSLGLSLAGTLQATLAIGSEWQELALVTPPLLPEEQWAAGLKVLKSKQMFEIKNGEVLAPPYPGIGLDVDEEAIERYRVRG